MKLADDNGSKREEIIEHTVYQSEFERKLIRSNLDCIYKLKVSRVKKKDKRKDYAPVQLGTSGVVHKYKLKLSQVGKEFLKKSNDTGLLKVYYQFLTFGENEKVQINLRAKELGIGILWLQDDCVSSLASTIPVNESWVAIQEKNNTLADKIECASPYFKRFKSSSPQKTSMNLHSSCSVRKVPRFEKNPSFILENDKRLPKRKSISLHGGLAEDTKQLILKKFKILKWEALNNDLESVIVVFNECVTIDLELMKDDRMERWLIQKIEHKIFSLDKNLLAILGACIDYVSLNYSNSDLLGFLSILFIVHHDVSELYKKCRRVFSQIRVDKKGEMRISGESGIEVKVDLLSNEVYIDFLEVDPDGFEIRNNKAFSNLEKLGALRENESSFLYEIPNSRKIRNGELFCPQFIDVIESTFFFCERFYVQTSLKEKIIQSGSKCTELELISPSQRRKRKQAQVD